MMNDKSEKVWKMVEMNEETTKSRGIAEFNCDDLEQQPCIGVELIII